MVAVAVVGADARKRDALAERVSAVDGLTLISQDELDYENAELVVVAADQPGIGLIRRIVSGSAGAPPPLLLVVDEPFEELTGAIWLGVTGIVLSSAPDRELADCAALVAGGCTVFPAGLFEDGRLPGAGLAAHWVTGHGSQAALDGLSRRELEVLALVGGGLSNSEIAAALWLSANTVRTHIRRLMQKLGLRNRLCVIIFAHEAGLVTRADAEAAADTGLAPACPTAAARP
ncbi:response regulator transcription factor [Kitasatospora purpeofusca]|uniref:response regulator transcription factor n=1 Tax=Kitasatospora purpeofusca TaxID=67352 RepID=UPI00386DADFD|nr:response regulator transcription factor [Kitasatospora purpeofusca]